MVPQIQNLILIGMPGSGKSTLGRLLADRWDWRFVDVDPLIVERHGKSLAELQDERGRDGFIALEAAAMMSLSGVRQVIAPGGSVIYNPAAMAHLRGLGRVVYLETSTEDIEARIGDLRARGVVIAPGQTVADLCRERHPYYVQYAHQRVRLGGDNPHASATELAIALARSSVE